MRRVFFLAVAGAGATFVVGCSQGPRHYSATVHRTALNQPSIRIDRVRSGVTPDEALFEEQGYQEAYDRFFQMDMLRRLGTGRISELFGEKGYEKDLRLVSVGLRHAVARNWERIQKEYPESKLIVEAFSRGVNRFLSRMPSLRPVLVDDYEKFSGVKGYRPPAWEPKDSLAVALTATYFLSGQLEEKLMMAKAAAPLYAFRLEGRFDGLFDWRPVDPVFIMDAGVNPRPFAASPAAVRGGDPFPGLDMECESAGYPFSGCSRNTAMGSNNWVLSRAWAGGEHSFLANDPHLHLTFPWAFYEVALDSTAAGGSFHVRGFNLPGIPGISFGHNDSIAWGFTNLAADTDDIYLEILDEDTRGKVKFRDAWVTLGVEKVEIEVRNRHVVERRAISYRTVPHHGPLFSDHYPKLERPLASLSRMRFSRAPLGMSYRWTGLEGTAELAALLAVNRAKDFDGFKKALSTFDSGTQNMVFMDRAGNIGYYANGKYPMRPHAKASWPPYVPQLGQGEAEWAGYRTQVPELYNPASGRIVTANNDPYGHSAAPRFSEYRDYFGYGFSTGIRAGRITTLLDGIRASKGRVTIEDNIGVQTDHVDMLLVKSLDALNGRRDQLKLEGGAATLFDALTDRSRWKGEMDRGLEEPVLADAWLRALRRVYFGRAGLPGGADALPPALLGATVAAKTMYHRIREGLAKGEASAADILRESFVQGAKSLEEKRLTGARWGQTQRMKFMNVLEGILPTFSYPLERDGSWETVDVASEFYGPNFRLVMSAGPKGIDAIASVPGGNFTAALSSGLVDELTGWRDGRYRALPPFLPVQTVMRGALRATPKAH